MRSPMIDPIYHRQEFDTDKSWQAFLDFKSLPRHCRSAPTLLSVYQERVRLSSGVDKVNPPSLSPSTLERWCAEYKWKERAKAHDVAQKDILEAARREAVESGLILLPEPRSSKTR
jgi:hypothetical protein